MQTYTVLIIDDDNTLRQLVSQVLEVLEVKILEAAGGAEGFSVLQQHDGNVDLILLDVFMPQLDGIQFLKQLKSVERFAAIPVIMLTAATDKTRMIDAVRSGARHYITKPFNSEDLLTRIVQVLGIDII